MRKKNDAESWDVISEWDCDVQCVDFVEKHKASDKIKDVTEHYLSQDLMRFEVVKSMNIQIPNKNESAFILTTKAISLLDVINYIEKTTGKIDEAVIFFYTINDKAALYTIDLSKRCDLKIIISDLMNSQRAKERLITKLFDENNVEIVFCHNHAKIAAVRIGENHLVLSGSMNAGNNARIESLEISNSMQKYNFIKDCYLKFKNEFQINKRY